MKAYWDASALIEALSEPDLRQRLKQAGGLTRSHSLAEVFSALSGGNINLRVAPDKAAEMVANIANDLSFFDLAPADVISALKQRRRRGVSAVDGSTIFFMLSQRKNREPRNC